MELDELRATWTAYDRRLDESLRLNTMLLQRMMLDRTESALKRLSLGVIVELGASILAVLWLGAFLRDHLGEPHFFLPALLLHLGLIVDIGALVYQIVAVAEIDYSAPIVEIQKRLATLRVIRVRVTKWTLLLIPLAWTPALIVLLKGLLGVDAYALFRPSWFIANLLFGLVVLVAGLWIARRYAERLARFPLMQRVMRDIAGANLIAAETSLRSLQAFEQGEPLPRSLP